MKKFVFLMLVLMGLVAFFAHSHTAYAACPNGSSGVDDNIICAGGDDGDGVTTGTGNDTVNTNGFNINNPGPDGIDFGGNGTLQGDGNVSGDSNGIQAVGDVSTSGSGILTGTTFNGIQAGGNVTNSGSGDMNGGFNGIQAGGDVTNSGSGNLTGTTFNGIQATGNVTNSGSGTVSGGFNGIQAGGDVSNSSSGDINGGLVGIQAIGNVTNGGSGDINGGDFGIQAGGDVNNSGSGTVSGYVGISGNNNNQTFTLSNGTIIGTSGEAVSLDDGDDTVSVTVSSVTVSGSTSGGPDIDTLELNGKTNDQAGWNFFESCMTTPATCSGTGPFTVNANGKTFIFRDFEAFINNMTLIVAAAGGAPIDISIGGDAPIQAGVQAICEGAIKVFRQPNGDLDVYSGFDFLPPNGFMVGRITQTELAAGGRRFQDIGTAAQLGWVVEVTLSDRVIIQVFDGQGNPIGTCTP